MVRGSLGTSVEEGAEAQRNRERAFVFAVDWESRVIIYLIPAILCFYLLAHTAIPSMTIKNSDLGA
jgi:hypothetical protein